MWLQVKLEMYLLSPNLTNKMTCVDCRKEDTILSNLNILKNFYFSNSHADVSEKKLHQIGTSNRFLIFNEKETSVHTTNSELGHFDILKPKT